MKISYENPARSAPEVSPDLPPQWGFAISARHEESIVSIHHQGVTAFRIKIPAFAGGAFNYSSQHFGTEDVLAGDQWPCTQLTTLHDNLCLGFERLVDRLPDTDPGYRALRSREARGFAKSVFSVIVREYAALAAERYEIRPAGRWLLRKYEVRDRTARQWVLFKGSKQDCASFVVNLLSSFELGVDFGLALARTEPVYRGAPD